MATTKKTTKQGVTTGITNLGSGGYTPVTSTAASTTKTTVTPKASTAVAATTPAVVATPVSNAIQQTDNSASDAIASALAKIQSSSYTPSANVSNAYSQWQAAEAAKPAEYVSAYSDQIQSLLDSILNRESFSYDFNADPLYQQYKDQYTQGGKLAMMDTMANASALSGGYGNSYASTAGNQAYQSYLSQLNDVIPDLANQALNVYTNEGNTMYNNLDMLNTQENTDYGKYRDTVSDYYTDRSYYGDKYNTLYGQDYGQYSDSVSNSQADRNYALSLSQANQDQANWQTQYDYQVAQDALAAKKAASSGSSSKKDTTKEPEINSTQKATLKAKAAEGGEALDSYLTTLKNSGYSEEYLYEYCTQELGLNLDELLASDSNYADKSNYVQQMASTIPGAPGYSNVSLMDYLKLTLGL